MRKPVTVTLGDHAWKIDYAVLQKIAEESQPYIKDFGTGTAAVAEYLEILYEFMGSDVFFGLGNKTSATGGIDHHDEKNNIEHHAAFRLHHDSVYIAMLHDWILLAAYAARDHGFDDKVSEVQKIYVDDKRFPNYEMRRFFESHTEKLALIKDEIEKFSRVALPNGAENKKRGRDFSADKLEQEFKRLDSWDEHHQKKVDFVRKFEQDPTQVTGFLQTVLDVIAREGPLAEPKEVMRLR